MLYNIKFFFFFSDIRSCLSIGLFKLFLQFFTCRGLDLVFLRDPSVGLASSLAQEACLICFYLFHYILITPNCNKVVIEKSKKQKANSKKPNRNLLTCNYHSLQHSKHTRFLLNINHVICNSRLIHLANFKRARII